MKLQIKPISVVYVSHMGTDLTPVQAARISFGNTSEVLSTRDKKLMKYLADHQHMTPFEHQTLTVIIECPLYVRSQIHRHRTFAFNEISRRYSAEDLSFYIPEVNDIRQQSKSNKQGSDGSLPAPSATKIRQEMIAAAESALEIFESLLASGVAREQARAFLPQALNTRFYMTGNLRNWIHFLKLRLDGHAQKEVRDVAEPLKAIIFEIWPESAKVLLG